MPEVEVIATTPLPSLGTPLKLVPGNVQSAEDEDIYRHEALDLTNFMNRTLSSVHVDDVQSNPFQPDLTYRGFIASPLIGTPIGLSVYEDGVRINEPFGDTVNWDLIPRSAIANIDLISGSNPLFGLNTLGGALSVRTKSGFSHPGTRAQAYGGSFGRRAFEIEHGGFYDQFDWFLTANVFDEDGWRQHSDSRVRQVFGKVGWENQATDIDLSYTFASNKLTGNGPLPESQLKVDRSAVFTSPDSTQPELHFFNLRGSHQFTPAVLVSGNAYYRGNTIATVNGDVAEGCALVVTSANCLNEDGELIPAAVLRRSHSDETGTGATLQVSDLGELFTRENQFTVGTSFDYGDTDFTQSGQAAVFSPSRATIGTGEVELLTRVQAMNNNVGVFATDTLSLTPWWHFNASGRWNRAEIDLSGFGTDRADNPTALTGHHTFERINPSAGFTVQPLTALSVRSPLEDLTFYGNYNEGFRAPTPVELTCADASAPCALPSSFIADPALKPVVARTWEVGLRGNVGKALRWNSAAYRTELDDDILFSNVPGGTLTRGFFQNVGKTRRQGVELGLQGAGTTLNWYANYSVVEATYQTHATLQSALGPEEVRPGDRIPGVPEQRVNAGVEYEVVRGWLVGGDLEYASGQFLRGDDANRLSQVPDYVVVNVDSRYRINKYLEIFAWVNNVFDQNYETFGAINVNPFSGQRERFLGPGAPIAGWAGLRLRLD